MTGSPQAARWGLDPSIDFLNHGSFGACPRDVLEFQAALRDRMEAEPVQFLGLLAGSREALAAFIGASPDDLAFVTNATTGVNTVLQSLRFGRGDELLTTDHEYNAILNAARAVAARDGAQVVVAHVPFPIGDPADVIAAVLGAVTDRTRLALISHVTSPTALIFPAAELIKELTARGIDTLLDAAHSPGMLPVDLNAIGAAYATGNAHKWICGPQGPARSHPAARRIARGQRNAGGPVALSGRVRLDGNRGSNGGAVDSRGLARRRRAPVGRLAGAHGRQSGAHPRRQPAPVRGTRDRAACPSIDDRSDGRLPAAAPFPR